MACSYCGANLTIPAHLRTQTPPRVETPTPQAEQASFPEVEAAEFIRKAQPVALGAFNLYALWTWVRWLFPACLTIFILGCVAVGLIPLIFGLTR